MRREKKKKREKTIRVAMMSMFFLAVSVFFCISCLENDSPVFKADKVEAASKKEKRCYYIDFKPNGGTGTMERKACAYGKSYDLPENAFTKDGYEFTGWNTKSLGVGTQYENQTKIKNLTQIEGRVVTLYAQWKLVDESKRKVVEVAIPEETTSESTQSGDNADEGGALDSFAHLSSDGGESVVGDMTYSIQGQEQQNSVFCTLKVWKTSGGEAEIVSEACGTDAVTNGTYIYYGTGTLSQMANYATYKNRSIVQYNTQTKESTTIVTDSTEGLMYNPFACTGDYVYIGTSTQQSGVYGLFYVLNIKTGKMEQIGVDVSEVQSVGDKILVSGTKVPHGGSLYLMNRDGSHKKELSDEKVTEVEVKDDYIYFTEATSDTQSRQCKCKLDGTKKENLTSAENASITFEDKIENGQEYAVIESKNDSGTTLWSVTTDSYTGAQCDVCIEIGQNGDGYYYIENGTVVKLDVSSGNVIWRCTDVSVGSPAENAKVFGDDGTLFVSGYDQPDFVAIDKDGKVIYQAQTFSSNQEYFWPYKLDYQKTYIDIYFEGNNLDEVKDTIVRVDLQHYSSKVISS